jgi:hypothetical protein
MRRAAPQSFAHRAHIEHFRGAIATGIEVFGDHEHLRAAQLAVDKRTKLPAYGQAADCHGSLNASRSDSRARARRDLTVPTATPNATAISSYRIAVDLTQHNRHALFERQPFERGVHTPCRLALLQGAIGHGRRA